MLNFKYMRDPDTHEEWVDVAMRGKHVLSTPQINKDTAFTEEERREFGLLGKLPLRVETLEEQVERAYQQYHAYHGNLQKNIFLNSLHDTNQTIFYRLVSEHLSDMLPVIYTPIVGSAVKQFSHEFRNPRGLYISYPDRDAIRDILRNRSNPEIDIIVVTDGEGVLGIGDQGVGAIDIPIAKLMVYSLVGGINPSRTLPIQLDVGTNNQTLLDDPMYLGWRHERIDREAYDAFVRDFVVAVKEEFPGIYLHFEDFGRDNARRVLDASRDKICAFNDDIQGTGVITVAAILAAVNANQSHVRNQQVVIFGAGTAGTGVADQIFDAMVRDGLNEADARKRFWLLDRPGLLMDDMADLTAAQQPYAHPRGDIADWQLEQDDTISLADVVNNIQPTILIGSSAVTGAFSEDIIKTMAEHTKRPIILPLSNPTDRCEAQPDDIMYWTSGQALIATGSPFEPVKYNDSQRIIAQCNNALAFPGIGVGVKATHATHLSDDTLWEACKAIAQQAPVNQDPHGPILPTIDDAHDVSKSVAKVVAEHILEEGNGQLPDGMTIEQAIEQVVWEPRYLPYKGI